MKICDRCHAPACEQVVFQMDDQHIDLCASCRQVALEVLMAKVPTQNVVTLREVQEETPTTEKRRGGRPRKND